MPRAKQEQPMHQPLRPHVYDMTASSSFERASAPAGFRGSGRIPKRLPSQPPARGSTPSTSASASQTPLRSSAVFSSHASRMGTEEWDIPGRAISSQSIRRPLESPSTSDVAPERSMGARSFMAQGSKGKVYLPGNTYQNPDPVSNWGFASSASSRPSTALSMPGSGGSAPAGPQHLPDRPWTESSALSALRSSLSTGALRPQGPGAHHGRTSLMSAASMGPSSPSSPLMHQSSALNASSRPTAEPSMSSQGRYFECLLGGRLTSQPQLQPQCPRPLSSSHSSPALQRSTLNGIGHPSSRLSISIPHVSSEAQEPEQLLASSPRRDSLAPQVREVQDVSDEGLAIMLASTHWRKRSTILSLVSKQQPEREHAQRMAEEDDRRQAMSREEGWLPARAPGFVPARHENKPAGDDPLNLWRGKRLTAAEMKVEQQLHALRMNPGAKANLEKRISTYKEEKQQGNADKAARAKVAMEQQRQRAAAVVARLAP